MVGGNLPEREFWRRSKRVRRLNEEMRDGREPFIPVFGNDNPTTWQAETLQAGAQATPNHFCVQGLALEEKFQDALDTHQQLLLVERWSAFIVASSVEVER